MKNINLLCGIDTLYYFVETNKNYDDMYLDILDQLEDKKAMFERKEIDYLNTDIYISINDIALQYLSCAEGYHWFKDTNELFRIGFKDEYKNRGLHNIRIQLQGVGIYTIGIKPLLSLINETLLNEVTTRTYPITRADINCFVNYDFSFIDKSMFVSRKKRYMSISEFGSANKIETLYVGKAPFMLRLYNKKLELSKSDKKELMVEYFANNDLDIDKPIFNIEFEMHRTHLRAYEIKTVDELLQNANNLFKKAMEDIRLIDTNTITNKDIANNSKNRATTLPIWEYIKECFNIEAFMQIDFPIKRLKRKEYNYDIDRFIEDYNSLLKKARTYQIHLNPDLLYQLTQNFLDDVEHQKEKTKEQHKKRQKFISVEIVGEPNKYRLLPNGDLIQPINIIPFTRLNNIELEQEIIRLEGLLHFGEEKERTNLAQKLSVAYKEKLKRREV